MLTKSFPHNKYRGKYVKDTFYIAYSAHCLAKMHTFLLKTKTDSGLEIEKKKKIMFCHMAYPLICGISIGKGCYCYLQLKAFTDQQVYDFYMAISYES